MTAILMGLFLGLSFGGPIGALVGACVAAWLTQLPWQQGLYGRVDGLSAGFRRGHRQQAQSAFFNATFLVMGRLAKADGRVSQDEIAMALTIMQDMRLSADQRQAAIALFNQGKQAHTDIDGALLQFRQVAGASTLIPLFLEIQLQAAYADGGLNAAEIALFRQVCHRLGVSALNFERLHKRFLAQRAFYQGGGHYQQQQSHRAPSVDDLQQAYAVLGVMATATDAQVKQAYRKLMNQHHPDKLVAKGLPEAMMAVAKQRAQEIQAAYQTVREHRKHRR